MKTGGGDFSPEAYEQLREAYGKELQRQVDDEVRGTQLMGQEYGLETAPVDSPWADKIELWEYPDGKRDREDEKQSPDEILQIMRDAAKERIDALKEDEPEGVAESESEDEEADDLETMTDEEFEAHVDKLLEDIAEDEEDEDEEETEEEESEEEDDTENEEDTEEEPESDSEPEPEPEEEEVESEDDDYDPEEIAAQIAELRAEWENMQFVTEQNDEPE